MKIDIDLSDIFDEGEESVNDSVKDTIINTVVQKIYSKIDKEISIKVSEILIKGITEKLHAHLDKLIPELMEYEFAETGMYGASKEKTTVKNRILKQLETECKWKDARYESDKNAFTKAVEGVVSKMTAEFKAKFNTEVNALFVKETLEHAQLKLREKLGIK